MVLFLILLLFVLTSVLGLLQFQKEEGTNITLRWSSPDKTDLSHLHMNCRLTISSDKVVFEMIGGDLKYQDVEFSGRVEFDKEALKQGHVVLYVTGLRALDSGQYQCEMAATDQDRRQWVFTSTEYFKLEVTPKGAVSSTKPPHADDGHRRIQTKYTPGTVAGVVCVTVMIAPAFLATVMYFIKYI